MANSTASTVESPTDDVLARSVVGRGLPADDAILAAETLFRRHGHRSLGYLSARVPPGELEAAHVVVWKRVLSRLRRRGATGNVLGLIHEVAHGFVAERSATLDAGTTPYVSVERRDALARCLSLLDDERIDLIRSRLGAEGYEAIGERSTTSAARVHKLYHRATDELLACFHQSYEQLYVLDQPEKPSQLATWLERHVAGLHLADVVAELDAVHAADGDPSKEMERALGSLLSEVLSSGLSVLGRNRLVWFLQNPTWLLDLQDRVLVAGGPYWTRVAEEARSEAEEAIDRQWNAVRVLIAEDDGADDVESPPTTSTDWLARLGDREQWIRLAPYAITSAVTALLVFVLLRFVVGPDSSTAESPRPAPDPNAPARTAAWGWNRPDLLDAPTDHDYLMSLADGANEWFHERPESAKTLARRLGEFRAGCSRLLLERHDLLGPEDRNWLRERCRGWADTIDQQLFLLESGGGVEKVRSAADGTIRNAVKALKARASHQ